MKHRNIYFGSAIVIIVLFFINAFTPVEVLGCFYRGLVATILALASGIAGIITGIVAIKKRVSKDPSGNLWMLLTLTLTIPVAALVIMA
jgi:hypothetical protein